MFSNKCPLIYDRLNKAFDVRWNDGLIIAYYPSIHCKFTLPPEKIVHEMVHVNRQKDMGVELWYDMYIEDPAFRLEEEVLAYRAEYEFLKRHVKDRELLYHLKRDMAVHLSSGIYGKIVSLNDSMKLIS